MKAFKENPIITLALRNYLLQYEEDADIADTWTALNKKMGSAALGTTVEWAGSWADFIDDAFPEGTIFEAKKAIFENGSSPICLFLDGSEIYGEEIYFVCEIANGGLLKTHRIEKVNGEFVHSFEPNEDSSEELLNALTTVYYNREGGSGSEVTPVKLHSLISGSKGINADLNEDSSKLDIHPDLTDAENGQVWTVKTDDSGNKYAGFDNVPVGDIYLFEVSSSDIVIEPNERSTLITTSASLINPEKYNHIMWEVEGTGVHYGGDCILHPFNGVQGSQCFSAGRFLAQGVGEQTASFHDFIATVDDAGQISITLDGIVIPEEGQTVHICFHEFQRD